MKTQSRALLTLALMGTLVIAWHAGCAPRHEPGGDRTSPHDGTAAAPVSVAAQEAIHAYANALATEADATAAKAHKYRGWQEAFDDWQARNKSARDRSFKRYTDAMNAATLDGKSDAPFDAAKLEKSAKDAAKGFRGMK